MVRLLRRQKSFAVLGFEDSEKMSLYRCTAAVLHFGEAKFKQRPREEQAEADGSAGTTSGQFRDCSVLFFSRPRSEGWPHRGRTFSIHPCPLSF